MSFDALLATPHGPLVTLGRNVASLAAAFLGLSCVLLPSLLGVSAFSAVAYGLVGVALIGVFAFHLFRWKAFLRGAIREAASVGAYEVVAFMQLKAFPSGSQTPEYLGSGWALILEDCILFRFRSSRNHPAGQKGCEPIAFRDIVSVSRTEATSMEYAELVVALSTTAKYSFILVPSGGSGWRGPTEEETEAFQVLIERRLGERN